METNRVPLLVNFDAVSIADSAGYRQQIRNPSVAMCGGGFSVVADGAFSFSGEKLSQAKRVFNARRRQCRPYRTGRCQGLAVARETSNVCVHPEKERERMKCSLSDTDGLSAEIENLRTFGPEELDQTWRDLFGSDRPGRVCGDLRIKALGYRLQEKAIGGLKPSTRRLLERWGRNGSERGPLAEPARTRLKAGTVLVREWHGVTHRVTVLDDGFDFDGQRFRSLSEIARKITGVRWSGPLFFGLKSFAREQRDGAE
jgi:hypothetical protein